MLTLGAVLCRYIAKFLADGEWYLAVPLFLVSGIWPYAKLCLAMMLLHAPPSIISLRLRGRLLEGSNFMAKWAKVHMDIVSLLLVMVTLSIVIGDGNADDAFPLATATTSVDPRWQAYQICVLYAATILSQMVMVAHYEAYEATAASKAAATSARGAFPPPSPLRSLAIALGEAATSRPSARPTTPVSQGAGGAGAPPVERTLSAAEAARPAGGEIAPVEEAPGGGGVTPGAGAVRAQQKWLRDREKSWARGTEASAARTTAGSEVEPMEALCRLPIRVWPMATPARPSLLARLGLVGGVLCCLTALSVGCVTPLFTVQLAGLPRLVVGDERDRTYSLWGVVTTLGEAARHLPVVMVVTQASFFVATFLAPVVIQLLALTLWLKPMTARARRAVGLALRLVYAWCGLDVICVLLLSMAILPVKDKFLSELSIERGCFTLEPLLRAYFAEETQMLSPSDSCIAFHTQFHRGLVLLFIALFLDHLICAAVLLALRGSDLNAVGTARVGAVSMATGSGSASELSGDRLSPLRAPKPTGGGGLRRVAFGAAPAAATPAPAPASEGGVGVVQSSIEVASPTRGSERRRSSRSSYQEV